MARQFVSASSRYLEIDQAPVTIAPMTVSLWFNMQIDLQVLLWIGDKDVTTDYWEMVTLSGSLQWTAQDSSPTGVSISGVSSNVWEHACAIEVSSNSRYVFLNGVKSAEGTVEKTPDNADRIAIGRRATSSPGLYADSSIAEVAIWDVVLVDEEVEGLAAGDSPFSVRPLSLRNYWTIFGSVSPEIDLIRGFDLTLFNAPVVSDHPPIIYPSSVTVPPPAVSDNVPRSGVSVSNMGLITV